MPDAAPPGAPPGAPPDPSAAAPGAPTAAPPALGLQAAAGQKIMESRKALEAALVVFGSESEEGQALVAAIKALGSIFPGEGQTPAVPAGVPMGGPKPGAQFGM